MTESLYQRLGAVEFPTVAADVSDAQLYSVFDPARDAILALLRDAINAELGAAWTVAVAACSGSGLSATPVASVYHDHVFPYLARNIKFAFPLLSLYRVSAVHEDFSIWLNRKITTWALEYVLPPLIPEDARHLMGAFDAVENLVPLITERGLAHPAHNGDAMLRETIALAGIDVMKGERGIWETTGTDGVSIAYPVLQLIVETDERTGDLAGKDPDFEGATIQIGVGDRDEIAPELISVDTTAPDPNR